MCDEYAAPHNRGMASHVFVKELYVTVRGAWSLRSLPLQWLCMAHGWLCVSACLRRCATWVRPSRQLRVRRQPFRCCVAASA